jgi:hypothetical protein
VAASRTTYRLTTPITRVTVVTRLNSTTCSRSSSLLECSHRSWARISASTVAPADATVSPMSRGALSPSAICQMLIVVSAKAAVPSVEASARESRTITLVGLFARTIPTSSRRLPRTVAETKRTVPVSLTRGRPRGEASSERRRGTRASSPSWAVFSISSPPTRRTTASRTRSSRATAPNAGTEMSPTPWVGLACAVTGRRPARSGRSVRQIASCQPSSRRARRTS